MLRRSALASAVIAAALAACGDPIERTSSTFVPPTPSASPAPTASPSVEVPLIALDVRLGRGAEQPGLQTPAPGGSELQGPRSFAVDEAGHVWLWDQANRRAIAYDGAKLFRAVALPDVPADAAGLLIAADRLYLRTVDDRGSGLSELEIDLATGRILRRAELQRGQPPIYPFERVTFGRVGDVTKGVAQRVGSDAKGNRYERQFMLQASILTYGSLIQRVEPSGRVDAIAFFSIQSPAANDYFVRKDGAVYQMEWLWGAGTYERVAVTRIIAPRP